jgi:hypothetical protein
MTHGLQRGLYVLLLLFCFLPAVPLAYGWIETVRIKGKVDRVMVALLFIVSGSFAWVLLGIFFPLSLGNFYSGTRYATINR